MTPKNLNERAYEDEIQHRRRGDRSARAYGGGLRRLRAERGAPKRTACDRRSGEDPGQGAGEQEEVEEEDEGRLQARQEDREDEARQEAQDGQDLQARQRQE